MSGRFFLDTNIFADTFDAKSPAKARRAAQLIRQAADTGNGVVSYQDSTGVLQSGFPPLPAPHTVQRPIREDLQHGQEIESLLIENPFR